MRAHFQAAQRFLHRLLKRATDGHHFTHRLHLRGQAIVGTGKFFKVKTWNFRDHVVDRRLERGGRTAAGDIVHQLIQRIAYRQLGGNFGNREAGGFGRQRGRARYARVHLDDDQTAIFRIDRELHIRAAGLYADFTQYRHRGVTHDLIFFVGQRLRRCHGNRVTGMNAHGVEVFDGADNDAVIIFVAHHFHFILFPANQRLINQQLIGWREIQTAFTDLFKLFAIVSNTAAGAAHGKRRTDDAGKADIFSHFQRFIHVVCDTGASGVEANALHRLIKALAIFCFINRIGGGADHGDAKLLQHALTFQFQRTVQRRLAAHGWQNRIRALFFNNLANDFPVNRLNIGGIRHFRIGHDGGRI